MRSNFRNLYADVFWFGVLAGSAAAFLSIYAARLGATSFQISLLSAGPGVINLLLSLPAGRWLEGKALIATTFWSAILQRSVYLALIVLPWLLGAEPQIWAIVLVILVTAIPQTVLAISFNAMFAEVTPAEARGEVVGKRNALMSVSMTVATLASGLLLDHIVFPLNYQVVFGLGAVGAIMSTYHLGQLRSVQAPQVWPVARPGMSWPRRLRAFFSLRLEKGQPLMRWDLLRGPLGPFMLVYLLFYIFQNLPLPLFPLVLVNQICLTDSQISLGNALFYGVMMLVSLRLRSLSARFGHYRLLAVSGILYCIYPVLMGLAKDATLYWLASLIGGGVWGIATASLSNRLMERVPDQERPAGMALHNLVLNLGILIGSLGGPLLNEWLGLQNTLLLAGGLRFVAGLLLLAWG